MPDITRMILIMDEATDFTISKSWRCREWLSMLNFYGCFGDILTSDVWFCFVQSYSLLLELLFIFEFVLAQKNI